MAEPTDTPPIDHRSLGVDAFNATWRLIEDTDRGPDGDLAMIHMAHASRHHWSFAGGPVEAARGEWMCSRVYSVVGRAEPARFHAERCLELCQANGIGDFDLAFAYEALARAARLVGDEAGKAEWLDKALAAAEDIADPDDRAHFMGDIEDLRG